ncbi:CIA30 family protein [Yoonia litorea]|uniref:Complex I intermediate-associated protein 30 (CIA30) n=1 Tax=Yoonia litorea TaxID=1123755 RepID=A0A1I6MJ22_9RHOB|nr:CIA30 family protein [Yoonia litorea]SFS15694.1 Complex I intermediate-associated protein 30 (CIA30) [Yoonia litorea]
MILTLLFLATTAGADPMLIEDFGQDATERWGYTSDRVMGGVSDGQAGLGRDGDLEFAQLRGQVSTANNGGFIQIRTNLSSPLPEAATGLALRVRGNGARYYVHLRPDTARRPWQFYQAAFDTTEAWAEVRIPWAAFRPQGGLQAQFRPSDIRSLGIVAYGADYEAALDVDWISTTD